MLPEIEMFVSWLRRKSPRASTAVHYASDLKLFFAWLKKPVNQVTVHDIDMFIEHCQAEDQAIGTVNRRLAALRSFFQFLIVQGNITMGNPVIPKRHFIRQGLGLPHDVEDKIIASLSAVMHQPRDRAMFLLMLMCALADCGGECA